MIVNRSSTIGAALAVLGIAALILGVKTARPHGLSGESRRQVFPGGDVQIEAIISGATHSLSIEVVNPFQEETYVYGFDTTCGCLASDFSGQYLQPSERLTVLFSLRPKVDEGGFNESIRIMASNPKIDGLGISVSGEVKKIITVFQFPDFGVVDSELGGRAGFSFLIEKAATSVLEIEESLERALVIHPGVLGIPLHLDWSSVECIVANEDDVLISGELIVDPIAFRGRLSSASIVFDALDSIGSGNLSIPITLAFVPLVAVKPSPIISKKAWDLETSKKAVLTLEPETQEILDGLVFESLGGLEKGLAWRITKRDGDWQLTLHAKDGNDWPNEIEVPFLFNGESFHLRLVILE